MKKHFSLFMMLAAMVAVPAVGATNWGSQAGSTADLTGAPAVRSDGSNVNYQNMKHVQQRVHIQILGMRVIRTIQRRNPQVAVKCTAHTIPVQQHAAQQLRVPKPCAAP